MGKNITCEFMDGDTATISTSRLSTEQIRALDNLLGNGIKYLTLDEDGELVGHEMPPYLPYGAIWKSREGKFIFGKDGYGMLRSLITDWRVPFMIENALKAV